MTYEYYCTACAHQWEAEQSISEPPLKTCPKCHAETAKRQVSGGQGFILKGGGWYADGYGSGSKSGSSTKSTTSTAESAKPETKTETKSESSKPGGGASTT